MKDKKLQVFVSSTFEDMKEERQAAVEAILSSENIPAGMELFAAGDESQMTVIKRWIEESDVYMLILGGRYGSIEKNTGKSYTHLEYEYAVSLNKPLFSIVISDDALEKKVNEKGTSVIEKENTKELKAFKNLVLQNLVEFYSDKKDIKLAIYKTLSDFVYRKELVGWIKGDNRVNTAQLAEEIARLTKENSELRSQALKNNNSALYSNLTYEELKGLLEKSKYPKADDNMNMFEYFIANGDKFTDTIYFDKRIKEKIEELESLEKLFTFKLLKTIGKPYDDWCGVTFAEEGHNFYLKALSLRE